VEIQRLIGRSLRGASTSSARRAHVWIDCDVLTADGGTRCAAITGGWVALAARSSACARRAGSRPTRSSAASRRSPAAWSAGTPVLDLDYREDSTAEVDANVVMTGEGTLVEVQATAERTPLSRTPPRRAARAGGGGIDELRGAAGGRRGGVKLVLSTRNAHKARSSRRSWRRTRSSRCPTTSSCRPRRGDVRRERAGQGARRRRGDRHDRDRRRLGDRRRGLGGRPGVRSARFAGEDATDEENLAKLLREAPAGSRVAYVCALAHVTPRATSTSSRGAARGRSRRPARHRRLRLRPRVRARRASRPDHGRAQPRGQGRDQPPGEGARELLAWLR
jgi:hypothetical protein